jgi:hypothetical protein
MIKLGFDVAVAIVLSLVVFFMACAWWREWRRKPSVDHDEPGNMRQCPYCQHMCVDDQHHKIMVCPVCKSYFEEELS